MKKKIIIWLRRYLPAEISAVFGALLGGISVHTLFHNPILTAVGGTVGDTVCYYGMIVFNDLRKQKEQHKTITFSIVIKTVRNMLVEFGPSEFLDSFIVRPFSLYVFPLLLGNVGIGLVVGKIVADIIFYIPTIIAYELRMLFIKE